MAIYRIYDYYLITFCKFSNQVLSGSQTNNSQDKQT